METVMQILPGSSDEAPLVNASRAICKLPIETLQCAGAEPGMAGSFNSRPGGRAPAIRYSRLF
jgi:hypothetical protein